ncbi:MAG: Fur family transcriptional regulator [Chloroflexota bacterium]
MRRTRQREVISRVVCTSKCHPSADYVYEEVRKELPGVSLGTVYRNLKVLAELGEVQVLDGPGGTKRYDACTDSHYHFVCERCGRIVDLDIELEADLDRLVAERTGFDVQRHTLEFRGVCGECRRSEYPCARPGGTDRDMTDGKNVEVY